MGCGVVVVVACISARMLLPTNGSLPVKSSYKTTPTDQRSARASTFFAAISCSGAMYEGVPSSAWVAVRLDSLSRFVRVILETPKSITLTTGEPSGRFVTNKFSGLISRWTTPSE